MKLYMIILGGKAKGCNVEVHDIQFVVAKHIDETVDILKGNWYGLPDKLHMDSYKVIDGADGYRVRLTQKQPDSKNQLFFVHLGGYRTDSTQEQHDIGLFVGETLQEVIERALKEMSPAGIQNHVDSIVCVESCLLSADGEKYYIELCESNERFNLEPDWFGYRKLTN